MFEEQTCGQCGVKFHPRAREIYVYKRNLGKRELLFCCYTCMRAFDREWERKKLKNREKLKTKKRRVKDDTTVPNATGLFAATRIGNGLAGIK